MKCLLGGTQAHAEGGLAFSEQAVCSRLQQHINTPGLEFVLDSTDL